MKKKILIITNHRKDRAPGQRFRFEQYLDYLEANGFDIEFSYFLNEKDDKIFYSNGNYFGKFLIIFKNIFLRIKNVSNVNKYDIIFIYREATVLGTIFFEKLLSKNKAKIIFDFDDSIWLENISEGNKNLAWLKRADKTAALIALSDLVFAGNAYLANYTRQFNENVVIVPTTIDTDEYRRANKSISSPICIGWSGSITTIQHFQFALPYLKILKEKYGSKICFKVIGDSSFENTELGIQGISWQKDSEILDLSTIDIGIMPLPDDEWAKGKCGLKGLQYMSLGIPTVMSPVGVNTDIIQDGVNGFLCTTTKEWVEKLSLLIESATLREELGKAGRLTVEAKYSVNANKNLYLRYFEDLVARK